MKSKLLYLVVAVLSVFSLTSCGEDSTEGMTFITYYPELTLANSDAGSTTVFCDKGGTYVEPGYTALLNGEDVSSQVTVSSNVNTSESGVYYVNYAIMNADGFESTASRKVIVTDPNDAAEGVYVTDAASYRVSNGAETPYGASYEVLVLNNGDGTYSVSDFLGGWYEYRAGYGSAYAMTGDINLAADGTVTMVSSYVAGWGDSADSMDNGLFDAATGTFSWKVAYAGTLEFYVTMYKQ